MHIRIARSARKHKIGNAHILAAMINAGEPVMDGDQRHYIGADDRGLVLHVVAIPDDRHDGGLAVIHAAPDEWRSR